MQRHLCERISVNALAKELYLSRSYLSEPFKANPGESLTSISSYLGFSSPSHFIRVFKKYSALLPGEYWGR